MEESSKYEITNSKINNIHDKTFRKLLKNKRNAVRIINKILKEENRIREEEIEEYTNSFITDKYKNVEADIIYKLKGKEVFFHIEHQTKVDEMMPYRILRYEVELIDGVLLNRGIGKSKDKIPIIIPIVVYTGEKKWKVKKNIREMQDKWKEYQAGMELGKYNLIDINTLDKEELLKEENIISKMLILEKIKTEEEMIEYIVKIGKEISKNKEKYTKEEIGLLNIQIKAEFKNRFKMELPKEVVEQLRIKEVASIMTLAERLDLDRERTNREAELRGIEEGKKETKLEMIKKMLKENLSINIIEAVSGFSRKQIEKIAKTI